MAEPEWHPLTPGSGSGRRGEGVRLQAWGSRAARRGRSDGTSGRCSTGSLSSTTHHGGGIPASSSSSCSRLRGSGKAAGCSRSVAERVRLTEQTGAARLRRDSHRHRAVDGRRCAPAAGAGARPFRCRVVRGVRGGRRLVRSAGLRDRVPLGRSRGQVRQDGPCAASWRLARPAGHGRALRRPIRDGPSGDVGGPQRRRWRVGQAEGSSPIRRSSRRPVCSESRSRRRHAERISLPVEVVVGVESTRATFLSWGRGRPPRLH